MGSVYQKCGIEVEEMVDRLTEQHYDGFNEVGLKIDLLFAHAQEGKDGQPSGPAITHNGYPALGLCRVVSLKDRVKGNGDVEIVLDGDQWPAMTPEQQAALLDHELYHIELRFNKLGKLDTDDIGRPKVSMRKHNRQYGWFDEMARRHGAASIEVQQASNLLLAAKSVYFEQGEFSFEKAGSEVAA